MTYKKKGYKFKPEKTEKKCSICGIVKPRSEYYVSHKKTVNGVDKIYLNGPCKSCARISCDSYRKMKKSGLVRSQTIRKTNIKMEFWNTNITLEDDSILYIKTGCSREDEIRLVKNGFAYIIDYGNRDCIKRKEKGG